MSGKSDIQLISSKIIVFVITSLKSSHQIGATNARINENDTDSKTFHCNHHDALGTP